MSALEGGKKSGEQADEKGANSSTANVITGLLPENARIVRGTYAVPNETQSPYSRAEMSPPSLSSRTSVLSFSLKQNSAAVPVIGAGSMQFTTIPLRFLGLFFPAFFFASAESSITRSTIPSNS